MNVHVRFLLAPTDADSGARRSAAWRAGCRALFHSRPHLLTYSRTYLFTYALAHSLIHSRTFVALCAKASFASRKNGSGNELCKHASPGPWSKRAGMCISARRSARNFAGRARFAVVRRMVCRLSLGQASLKFPKAIVRQVSKQGLQKLDNFAVAGFFLECGHATGVNQMMRPERLSHLLDRYAAALELYARQWCAVPEDVVQEAFLKLVRQTAEPRQIGAWLYRVVRNGAISAGRSARRRQLHEAKAALQTPWFNPDETHRLDAQAVTAALEHLPPDERETIIAHLWGELTFEQIGELMGTSAATAYRRYVAGLKSLRERLHLPCPPNRTT